VRARDLGGIGVLTWRTVSVNRHAVIDPLPSREVQHEMQGIAMTTRLTEDLRDILDYNNDLTLRLYDERNQRAYVVVPEAVFERMVSLTDDEEIMGANLYPHVGKLLAHDGLGDAL
jgi:hypothetical protein